MINSTSQLGSFLGWIDSLTDPTRLRLLRLVERQELSVAELCEVLQMPQSTVSRHLKVLTDQGWASCRRHGTTNLYRSMVDDLEPAVRKLWALTRQQTDQWDQVGKDQLRLARRLEQRKSRSQAFFASTASQWDKLRVELYGQSCILEAFVAMLPSDWMIADLGCGTGHLTAQLASSVRRVIGVDHSAAMLKAARKRTAHLDNVELRRGDLEAVPIDDGSCDAVVLMLVLTYVSRPIQALAQAARILRPGGKVVVVDLLGHDRESFRQRMGQHTLGFEIADMEKGFLKAGLIEPQCRALVSEPQAKGPDLMLATAIRAPEMLDVTENDLEVT